MFDRVAGAVDDVGRRPCSCVIRCPCLPSRSRSISAPSASSNWIVWPLAVLMILRVGGSWTSPASVAVGVVRLGHLAVSAGLAPVRADPDRELQVALLELHPHPGLALRDEQQSLAGGAAVGHARRGPAGDHVLAQHAGHRSLQPAEPRRVLVVDHDAPVLAVEPALEPPTRSATMRSRSTVTRLRPPRPAGASPHWRTSRCRWASARCA